MAVDNSNEAIVERELQGLEADVDAAIRNLEAAASSRASFSVGQTGFDNNPTWTITKGREVALAGLGDLPVDRPELTYPPFVFNPEDYLNSDLLKKYSYDSEFYDNIMEPKLVDLINAQSYFIQADVQQALFDQMHERDIQVLNDQTDAVDRKQAERGFPMPTSILMSARNEVIKQHGDKRYDRNSEVTTIIADRAHAGMMGALGEGNKMESVRSQFQLEYGKLYWQAAGYIINQWEAEVKAEVARFQGDLDLIKSQTATEEAMAGHDQSYEAMEQAKQLERLRTAVAEMGVNLKTWLQETDMRMRSAQDSLNYYKGKVEQTLGILNDVAYEDYADKDQT
jgi:hypothetical protein